MGDLLNQYNQFREGTEIAQAVLDIQMFSQKVLEKQFFFIPVLASRSLEPKYLIHSSLQGTVLIAGSLKFDFFAHLKSLFAFLSTLKVNLVLLRDSLTMSFMKIGEEVLYISNVQSKCQVINQLKLCFLKETVVSFEIIYKDFLGISALLFASNTSFVVDLAL